MKLLITGALEKDEALFARLRAGGHEITFAAEERIPLTDQGIDPGPFEGVVCNALFRYNDIASFRCLRFIQLTSAGLDRVPMEYVRAHGIEIHNAAGVYSVPMAEFAVSGVLQLYKQSGFFRANQSRHLWEKHRGLRELAGKTVCILGCGNVGRECARRFAAFDCTVLGVNRTVRPVEHFARVLPLTQLPEALAVSDIVISAVALTPETRHRLDAAAFAAMKADAVFVNISRGAVVDEAALIAWLQAHPAAGAVLDVYEREPLDAASPLWDMNNVLLSPHNSFVGDGNGERMKELAARGLSMWKSLQ